MWVSLFLSLLLTTHPSSSHQKDLAVWCGQWDSRLKHCTSPLWSVEKQHLPFPIALARPLSMEAASSIMEASSHRQSQHRATCTSLLQPIVCVPQRRGSSSWLTCALDLLHHLHLAPLDLHYGGEAPGHHCTHGHTRENTACAENNGKIEVAVFLAQLCSQRRATPHIWCTIAALHRVFPSFFSSASPSFSCLLASRCLQHDPVFSLAHRIAETP
jgi:hypothetical protein